MDGTIRYCVVKKYKGAFKRKPVYAHLLFVPIDPRKYMYLALIGKDFDNEKNKYAAQLLVKLSEEITDQLFYIFWNKINNHRGVYNDKDDLLGTASRERW